MTGELGGAAAGLLLLEQEVDGLAEDLEQGLIARQLRPQPRLAEGRALAASGASAMIDISDGLGADAGHIAAGSGVALEIDMEAVPLAAGVRELADARGGDPLELAAGEGEDYELLACLPEGAVDGAREAVAAVGGALTVIGRVAGENVGVKLSAGSGRELQARGFDQLT